MTVLQSYLSSIRHRSGADKMNNVIVLDGYNVSQKREQRAKAV